MRSPAYARALLAHIASGRPANTILVFIDQSPNLRAPWPALAVFADTDPASLDWSLVRNRGVIVARADRVERPRLAATLAAIARAAPAHLMALASSRDDDGPADYQTVIGRYGNA